MDASVYTDPAKFGPLWLKIHIDGISATTDELKRAFVININALCNNFKCKKCQGHFRKFIDTHTLRAYWNIKDSKGRDIGFFKWTWELHNQVNKFLNKYQPSFEEAYNFYSDSEAGACFDCDPLPLKDVSGREKSVPSIPSIPSISPVPITPIIIGGEREELRTKSIPPILVKYVDESVKEKAFRIISTGKM